MMLETGSVSKVHFHWHPWLAHPLELRNEGDAVLSLTQKEDSRIYVARQTG